MFPVKRPGDYKRADWGLFFHFLIFFFPYLIAASLLVIILATRWTGNRLFFVDSLVMRFLTVCLFINQSIHITYHMKAEYFSY